MRVEEDTMRVLVTGAFGYVGRAVVPRLLAAGHQVVAVTRDAGRAPAGGQVHVVEAFLDDRERLRAEVARIDAVCHLAALTRVRESFARPDEYRAVNVGGTITLLDLLAERRQAAGTVIPFVFASTAAVYGAPERQPIAEDTEPAPASPYGQSKLDAENEVRRGAAKGEIGAVVLRAFNVAGSVASFGDPDETRIIPRAVLAAAGLRPPLAVNGDGSAVRDYVHVDDLARAYVLALGACRPGGFELYNVGATGASVRDILAAVRRVTGREVPVVHNPPQPE
ncbi:MAG: NAD-dependent epimerase/dehydratase family protein, partial [Actinocrinis sp.]